MSAPAVDTFDVLEYPFVFFPVGLNVKGRRCVVIGDDREAVEKDEALREVGADVVWHRDATTVTADDVKDAFFVIFTPQEEEPARHMRALADEHKFLLCAIDQPRYGFVAMQAIVKAGPVRIAVSTGGIAPRVGGAIRSALQGVLDAKFVRFVQCLNAQRERNKRWLDDSSARRKIMIARADGFAIDVAVRYPAWFEDELAAQRPSVVGGAMQTAGSGEAEHASSASSPVRGTAHASESTVAMPLEPMRVRPSSNARERLLVGALGFVAAAFVAREITRG